MTRLATSNGRDVSAPSWGEASEKRGRAHLSEALRFVQRFPIGSKLSAEEFDVWAQSVGMLTVPVGYPTHSDTWKAHVQKRHKAVQRINKSRTHPRLMHHGSTPFVFDWIGGDLYEVNPPQKSVVINDAYPKIAHVLAATQEKIKRMFQATDFSMLPPHEQAIAEQLFDDVTDLVDAMNNQIDHKVARIDKFRRRVEFLVHKRERDQLPPPDRDDDLIDGQSCRTNTSSFS